MVLDYDDLFLDVADALREHEKYDVALRFYSALRRNPRVLKSMYWFSMAVCYRGLGNLQELEQCYIEAIEEDCSNYEALVQLARLYEDLGRKEAYAEIITKLQIAGKRKLLDFDPPSCTKINHLPYNHNIHSMNSNREEDEQSTNDYSIDIHEKHESYPKRLENAQMGDQAARATYQRLNNLKDSMEQGGVESTSQWMNAAAFLVSDLENFGHKDTLLLKRTERAKQEKLGITRSLAQDLSLIEETSFREIHFDEWLYIVCQYTFLLAQRGNDYSCTKVITKALDFAPFNQDKERLRTLNLCIISMSIFPYIVLFLTFGNAVCAIKIGDEDLLQTSTRWFIKTYPYSARVYNFYTIVHHAYNGFRSRAVYNSGPSQKFMLRQLKSIDWVVMPPNIRESTNFAEQEKRIYSRRLDEHLAAGIPLPAAHLPSALAAHAHMLMAGGSYSTALTYYFHAYAIVPNDPALNLCIGVAYAQHALKRQSENRLLQIQIGASYMKKYKRLRLGCQEEIIGENGGNVTNDRIGCRTQTIVLQEVEFNEARFWHMLGLIHLAIPAYEKCLSLGTPLDVTHSHEVGSIGDSDDSDVEIGGHFGPEKLNTDCGKIELGDKLDTGTIDDYTKEAAFGLQLILVLSGDTELAEQLTERWLVI